MNTQPLPPEGSYPGPAGGSYPAAPAVAWPIDIIEPIPGYKEPCRDPSHPPPSHVVIPRGQQLRHTCPSCGEVCILHGNDVTFSV